MDDPYALPPTTHRSESQYEWFQGVDLPMPLLFVNPGSSLRRSEMVSITQLPTNA